MGRACPLALYQSYLDRLTPHLLRGAAARCLPHFALPFRSITLNSIHVCVTKDDLLYAISNYCDELRLQNVTRLDRIVDDARYLTDASIEGYHITYAHGADDALVTPAYAARVHLKLSDGVWRATEQEGVVDAREWPIIPTPRTAAPT